MNISKSFFTLSCALILAGCTTKVPYDPQIYGMPQSQFAKLTPEQQQEAIKFHNQYVQADYMSGSQVAQQSSNNVTTVSKTIKEGKKTKQVTTTISTPSVGNPDLVTQAPASTTPVVVSTN